MKRGVKATEKGPVDWYSAMPFMEVLDITLRLKAAEVNPDAMAHHIATFLEHLQILAARQRAEMEIALAEGLINAVDYGCLELKQSEKAPDLTGPSLYHAKRKQRLADPHWAAREILIRLALDPRKISIRIQDPGPGIPVTIARPKEILPYGRGIQLMRELMDRLIIKRNPSAITLIKYRG